MKLTLECLDVLAALAVSLCQDRVVRLGTFGTILAGGGARVVVVKSCGGDRFRIS